MKIKSEICLRINPEILHKFKMLALSKEKSYSTYVEELMERELKGG